MKTSNSKAFKKQNCTFDIDDAILSKYVSVIKSDDVFKKVILSEAFQRLNEISFLGAIDYLPEYIEFDKKERSRAKHSINVAALALLVAERRNYSQELIRHLVVAALLHDIGHPPLSHSVEPFLKKKFGYGHHEMGDMLLDGQVKLGEQLNKILSTYFDISFIKKLVAGIAEDMDGGDLFSSKINIDTIEGITRSYQYIAKGLYPISPVKIALASFTSELENKLDILDDFWRLKDQIYNDLITSTMGLKADLRSQDYFIQQEKHSNRHHLSKEQLFETEKIWISTFRPLFVSLKNIKRENHNNESYSFIKRKYQVVNKETALNRRYIYSKTPKIILGGL